MCPITFRWPCWPKSDEYLSVNSEHPSVNQLDDQDDGSCFDCFTTQNAEETQDVKDQYVRGLLSADEDSDDDHGEIRNGYKRDGTIPIPLDGHDSTL